MAEEFTPITTQEDFNSKIQERIQRAEASTAKKYEGYVSPEDVQKIRDEHTKEIADLNAKYAEYDKNLAERDAKIAKYETDSVKTRIATEMGIPAELATRITGSTEEEIKADAEKLSKAIGAQKKYAPNFEPEPKGTEKGDKKAMYKALASQLMKGNG